MYNEKQLREASEYLIKNYKGMEDIILHIGKDRHVSTMIMNIYRFRKLEDYGYSLEDIFMEVYVSILNKERDCKHISNISSFIQREIIKCIKDDLTNVTVVSFMNSSGSVDEKISNIQFRKTDCYDFDNEIDESCLSFIDDIIGNSFLEYLIIESRLTDIEETILREYFIEDKNMVEIARLHNVSQPRVFQKISIIMWKVRRAYRRHVL